MTGGVPPVVRRAAAALGVADREVRALGGATTTTFAVGPDVLRIGDPARLAREVQAMATAAAAVPVPRVLVTAELEDDGPADDRGAVRGALLLSRLPGVPAGDLGDLTPEEAFERGTWCGRLHAALAAVRAPDGFPLAGPGAALLHLDLHPFNVLVDGGGGDGVTGVVDWANTAAGPADLDRARSWSILHLDPEALALADDERFAALVRGWSTAAEFDALSPQARAWACRRMLDDLAGRHAPSVLEHVRGVLARLEAETATPGSAGFGARDDRLLR